MLQGFRHSGQRLLHAAGLLAAGTIIAAPRLAHAQTPAPAPPPPVHERSLDFAFVGTSGNASARAIGLNGEYVYRPAPWETRLKVGYLRNDTRGETTAQSFVLTLRAQRPIKPRLSGYGQYGYQRDRFAGILDRNALEAGLAYSWIDTAPHALVVDAGVGYANEQRLVGDDISTATLGGGAVYRLKISETSELSEDGHIVLSLSDGGDWRYANTVAVTAKMTTVFSLKLSNALRYVHAPVDGFKRTDVVTAVALVGKF